MKNVLYIFDIDDTLLKTHARVLLKDSEGRTVPLTPSEFNSYELKTGEEYDFSQFINAELFNKTSEPIDEVWESAIKTLDQLDAESEMIIVTARSDFDNKELFLSTFHKFGLDMNKIHVHRAGNLGKGPSASKKKIVIRNILIKNTFSEVQLYDDHQENLDAFISLGNEFKQTVFKAFPVISGKIGIPIIINT